MESKELIAEVKVLLEERLLIEREKKIEVLEPPHFFCKKESDPELQHECRQLKMKRTREELSAYLIKADDYLKEITEQINAVDQKRIKMIHTISELERWVNAKEPEVPVAAVAVPVPPPALPVSAAVAAPAAKGSPASVPARK